MQTAPSLMARRRTCSPDSRQIVRLTHPRWAAAFAPDPSTEAPLRIGSRMQCLRFSCLPLHTAVLALPDHMFHVHHPLAPWTQPSHDSSEVVSRPD